MLTRIIDWSLRHRWIVLARRGGRGRRRRARLPRPADRRLPGHDAHAGAGERGRPRAHARGGRAAAHHPRRAGARRASEGLEELRSISKFGLSQVTLRFADGTDLWFARQQVAERVGRVELPPGLERPSLGPVATGLGEVFHYLVKSETRSLEDAPDAARLGDRAAAPERPGRGRGERLGRQGEAVARGGRSAAAAAVRPLARGRLPRARGQQRQRGRRRGRARPGRATLVLGVGALDGGRAIEEVVVAARHGVPVRVRDVAQVAGRATRSGAARPRPTAKGEAILGLGFMLVGENSHAVTAALAKRLEEVKARLPADVAGRGGLRADRARGPRPAHREDQPPRGRAPRRRDPLRLPRQRPRRASSSPAAIPLSMLFAFDAMIRFGIAGTLMSLGAIDFGLVVDSSVILVENAERRLAEAKGNRSVVGDRPRRRRRGPQAHALRRADHHDRVPPDPRAGGGRGEDVPADGADGDLRAHRLDDRSR